MDAPAPLQAGLMYHIYNRGNNRENLFHEERNYLHFLELYAKHVHPIADTFAYCLMKNHFHLLVRIKTENEWHANLAKTSGVSETPEVSTAALRAFGNLFNAYAKALNKAYGRTGRLFEESFKRIVIDSEAYFTNLIFYIHFNPQKHGFVDDFREWKWSNYGAMLKAGLTKIKRDDVFDWFGGRARFEQFHQGVVDDKLIAPLIVDDFD